MSQFPNMDNPGSPPNPFASAPPGYQPPQKSRAWLWILVGAGGLGLLLCCGCGGLMWFGWSQASTMIGQQLVTQLNDDPTAKEHLGTVSSAQLDILASGKANEKSEGQNTLVFQVQGDKSTGAVRVKQSGDGQLFSDGWLTLPSGEEVQLGF